MYKLSPSSQKRLESLKTPFQDIVLKMVKIGNKNGLDVQIACGTRSAAQQDELYAQGRTRPGSIVTNAKGGQSLHNIGLAVDLYFLVGGKADWGVGKYLKLWDLIKDSVPEVEWAGNWKSFKEYCHFQIKGSYGCPPHKTKN